MPNASRTDESSPIFTIEFYLPTGVERVPIGPVPVLLGSQADGPGRLKHEAISRLHAEVRLFNGGEAIIIKDLGSTNGIEIDGSRTKESVVLEGSIIDLGGIRGILRRTAPSPTRTPFVVR